MLFEKLTTPNELSGLLNRSLKGLLDLLEADQFYTECKAKTSWKDIKELWFSRINLFSQFLIEKCEIGQYRDARSDPTNPYWHYKEDVFFAYNDWLKNEMHKPQVTQKALTTAIKQNGFSADQRRKQREIYAGFCMMDFERKETDLPKKYKNIDDLLKGD
jgi:hypothetical protein